MEIRHGRVSQKGGMGIMRVDSSDLLAVAKDMARVGAMTPRGVESALTRAANARINMLRELAPWQYRHDPRYSGHLEDSFSMVKSPGVRIIVTSQPAKLMRVTGGTKSHWIRPRIKKALYWPGLAHPVGAVFHHGTDPYPFVDMVVSAFDSERKPYIDMDGVASWVSGLFSGISIPDFRSSFKKSKKTSKTKKVTRIKSGKIESSSTENVLSGKHVSEMSDMGIMSLLLDGILNGILGTTQALTLAVGAFVAVAASAVEMSQEE